MDPDIESVLGTAYGTPIAQIYFDAVGKSGALGLMSLVFIVQYFMGLSILVAVSRQSWAFSRDGALPFSSYFKKVSVRLGYIPARAVWGCVVIALVLGLLCLIAPAAANALFSLAVAANNVAWGTPIFCRLVWGQKKFKPGPVYTGRFSESIGWLAIVFLVFGILLAMMPSGGPNPTPESMNYTVVVNCAVWGGSLAYYYIDARKWFTGPKITLSGEEDLTEEQRVAIRQEGLQIEGVSSAVAGDASSGEGTAEIGADKKI
jgi:amino acid transporter